MAYTKGFDGKWYMVINAGGPYEQKIYVESATELKMQLETVDWQTITLINN